MSFLGRIFIGFFLFKYAVPSTLIPLFFEGLISDLIKNKYKLPRSYLLAPIAILFFISQLMLATVSNITQLWIASLLLGLAHGSLYSLYPTLCLEWFGMGTYYLLPVEPCHIPILILFFYLSGSFINSPLLWKLGISRHFTLNWRKCLFSRIWTQFGCSRSSLNNDHNSFAFPPPSTTIHRPSPMLERTGLLCVCYLFNFISNLCVYRTLRLGWI